MNLKLQRLYRRSDGIFSTLCDDNGNVLFHTLEHAYLSINLAGQFEPKIPNGNFVCVRGEHQLANMTSPFSTFEITGVAGHTNILFHVGNFNNDSEGCVLMGSKIVQQSNGVWMISESAVSFTKFLQLLSGIDQFNLTVCG